MSAPLFPVTLDGRTYSCAELRRATGLSNYDVHRALQDDPTISTLAALKAAVVARKARPVKRNRPALKRASQLWNGGDRQRTAKS